MKIILVPVDFSAESLTGLKMALLISQKEKVCIRLIHVMHKLPETEKHELESAITKAEKSFEILVAEYSGQLGSGSSIEYTCRTGRIYQEVVNAAESIEDSIISASTHGASGFQEVFIGSNAFRIISSTTRPVIALRSQSVPESISRIVMPIDMSIDSRQKVPFTTEFARLMGAEIHVVGVHITRSEHDVKKIRSYVSQVAGFIEGKVHSESNEVFGTNVAELVLNYTTTVKADMLSITSEQSSGLSLIMGNTAHQILNKSDIPVLCLTPRSIRKQGTFVTTGG